MKTHLCAAALVAAATLTLALPARALMIAPPPTTLKFAVADALVVGKVTEIADKAVKAELYQGDTRELKVATVRVESSPLGKVGTTVKVGFVQNTPPAVGGGRPIRPPIGRGMMNASLAKDQEALLILVKHPTQKDLYVLANYYDVIAKKDNANFKKEVEEAKKIAGILASTATSLKAKNADDRLLAAAVLLTRYKTPAAGNNTKTEAVPADETKLLLNTLAEADWAAQEGRPGTRRDYQMMPQNLFFRLGATAQDGWQQPRDFKTLPDEAKKWLKANAGTFKLTRYVREKAVVQPSTDPDR